MSQATIIGIIGLAWLGASGLLIILSGANDWNRIHPLTDEQLERLCAEAAAKKGACNPKKLRSDCAFCPVFCDTNGSNRKSNIVLRQCSAKIWLYDHKENRPEAHTEEAAAIEAMAKQNHTRDLP